MSSEAELASAMNDVGRPVVSRNRPSLQVAQFTWTSNKAAVIINQGGYVALMTNYPHRTEESRRHTNKTVTYKMDVRLFVQYPAAFLSCQFVLKCYWWVIYDRYPNGQLPTASTIFDTFFQDFPNTWSISRDVCHRFVVKHKWVTTVKSNGSGATKTNQVKSPCVPYELGVAQNKFFKKLGCATEWKSTSSGDIGDIKSGALYLVAAGDGGKDLAPYVNARFGWKRH
ncbi:hypothetical protein FEM48_Zijuj02G0210300 [Ziziphus jujuba var. spinosa]|uniref:Coat protein n=1 Tax=Ziziphus jujuba var. spinosa TaxID=714518 RepID=A0A978VXX9_ZIZJJ|nr:hypothetical protein FEM48_Zijuj02G0210300 [Ziziphus jujuba var. spinosa]